MISCLYIVKNTFAGRNMMAKSGEFACPDGKSGGIQPL
jgi:hypothetical protein